MCSKTTIVANRVADVSRSAIALLLAPKFTQLPFATSTAFGLVWLFAAFVSATALAMPANDNFAAAVVLNGSSGRSDAVTVGATSEPNEPLHASAGGHSVWWRWTAPANGTVSFYTHGSNFDSVIAAYTGDSVSTLTEIISNNDAATDSSGASIRFAVQPGMTYRIAVDGAHGFFGSVALSWLFEPSPGGPINDLFDSATMLLASSGTLFSSNYLATKEPGEPDHGANGGGRSVWWRWTAPESGSLFVHTEGSNFDTTLSVYRGVQFGALALMASDDDSFVRQSASHFDVNAGTEYRIAIDGFDGDQGVISLHWAFSIECELPPAPTNPFPFSAAKGISNSTVLRWNGSSSALVAQKVVYGEDDRRDYYEVTDPNLLAAADASVALVPRGVLTDNGDGTFSLPASTFGQSLNVCSDEPFRDQPNPAVCSGFLVGTDLVATAGHCLTSDVDCDDVAFVFGFRMHAAGQPVLTFDASQIYFCSAPVGRKLESPSDWGLWRLDREVLGIQPLAVRRQGAVPLGQSLVLVGYPYGLPVKIAGGAIVRDFEDSVSFTANLDAYVGNSGSPVLNADTYMVEGILVSGETDFASRGNCLITNVCSDIGCDGERCMRTTLFDELVPARATTLVHDVFLAPCGSPLQLVGSLEESSWMVSDLELGTTYCWQIVTYDECGTSAGPLWTFETELSPRFVRADANADRSVNLADPVAIVFYLFGGGPISVGCVVALDANDDDIVNIADAVYVLEYLFASGAPPPPPFDTCGPDPTRDEQSCDVFPACDP